MQLLGGQNFDGVVMTGRDNLRRVVRSTTSPSPSPESADMASLMAKYDRLLKIRTVHGSMMSIMFVLLFPTFASLVHLLPSSKPVVRIHALLQAMTATLAIVGFGLGIYLNQQIPVKGKHHQVIGAIVVVLLVVVQPILGIRQHMIFRRTQRKTWWKYAHRWQGRVMLVLGVDTILAGLGGSPGVFIAYGVVAGLVYTFYSSLIAFKAIRQRRASARDKAPPAEGARPAETEEHTLTEIPAHAVSTRGNFCAETSQCQTN
ncbi:hypothetical protein N7463_006520 [Penicillium fimorum]|uniref:Cytochrome b561 domain-containing protein n=1 Tax=Penicillium fimorum TaxID=1882269 RepID=A0A9X0C6Q2_9EURO|nr:hypothetical protein N7463_006520 [Penicillium fimorum]